MEAIERIENGWEQDTFFFTCCAFAPVEESLNEQVENLSERLGAGRFLPAVDFDIAPRKKMV